MGARFEVVRTNADQSWHVRLVGANGEPVMVSENYADRRDALNAVRLAQDTLTTLEVDERGVRT